MWDVASAFVTLVGIPCGHGQRWSGHPRELLCSPSSAEKSSQLFDWKSVSFTGLLNTISRGEWKGHPEKSNGQLARGCVCVHVCHTWITAGGRFVSLETVSNRRLTSSPLWFTEIILMVGTGELTRQGTIGSDKKAATIWLDRENFPWTIKWCLSPITLLNPWITGASL